MTTLEKTRRQLATAKSPVRKPEDCLTVTEVSELTGDPVPRLVSWRLGRQDFGPPCHKVGHKVYYRRSAVERWMRQRSERMVTQ